MTTRAWILGLAGLLVVAVGTRAGEPFGPAAITPAPRKVALFISNHAGAAYQDKVVVLEAALSSRLGAGDFQVISRNDTVQTPTDQAGALRLGQQLGADFVLVATINSLAANESQFKDDQMAFTTVDYVLQTTYKVLDSGTGGAVAGDDVETIKKLKFGPSLKRSDGNVVNDLLRTAAGRIAQGCVEKTRDLKVVASTEKVDVAISCALRDLTGAEISLTDIRLGEDNKVLKGSQELPVLASASIDVDGIVIGTTPARVKLAPGLHKMRLTREGCEDYVATIDAKAGLQLAPTLQLTDAGYARWKDLRTTLCNLDNGRKLTDAEVKVLEGKAQELRQSGMMVKKDIQVDTKEGLKIYKSLY